MTTTAEAGSAGGTAVSPAVALSFPTNTTFARIGAGGSMTITGPLTASADHRGSTTTTADGQAAGSSVGVGGAVAVTVAHDKAFAVSDRNLTTTGTVTFSAHSASISHTTAKAGANGTQESGNAQGQIGHQLNFGNSQSGTSAPAPSPQTSDGGVGVAAAVAVNLPTSRQASSRPDADLSAGGPPLGLECWRPIGCGCLGDNTSPASAQRQSPAVWSSLDRGGATSVRWA
jgi:hypothetical protein